MPITNRIADFVSDAREWRQHLHAHPELRFAEHETAAFVAQRLRDFGCDLVRTGVGQTGVVAVIEGHAPGRTIAFRADMDALPLTERTGLPHASTIPGRMHACGHDGHTTMLLTAARYLAETRAFAGRVVLLFQPAEEGGGGAQAMLADGVLDDYAVDEVYAMHNWPGLAAGQFAVRPGTMMAAADGFEITVQGRGGHGARPHLAVDTTLAAAAIVVAMPSIPGRNTDPHQPVVVSVCAIQSDSTAYNVIPDQVILRGTTRFFDISLRPMLRDRIATLAQSTAAAYGATAAVNYFRGVDPVLNEAAAAGHAAAAARRVAGDVRTDMAPDMAAEDFADILAARPGAFVWIGNGSSADLHNPTYEFNDDIIPAGASFFATLAEMRLAKP
jgi:hippurate hydrolase